MDNDAICILAPIYFGKLAQAFVKCQIQCTKFYLLLVAFVSACICIERGCVVE
jgi:hypothetical protein